MKRWSLIFLIWLFGAIILTNCGKDDDASNPVAPSGTEATLSKNVQPIFNASCTGCHGGNSSNAGLNLETGQAHANLVGIKSTQDATKERVKAGDPANSYLVIKIEGRQTVGNRMPPGNSLSSSQIQTIKTWIEKGAANN